MKMNIVETVDDIEKNYYSYDILQLVSVIGEIFGNCGDSDNRGGRGDNGRIFFEADPSLAFPPGDVGAVEIDLDNREAVVRLPVMNLLGTSSPLPIKFSDHITRGLSDADVYRDFLSMMQNRVHAIWIGAHRYHAHSRFDMFSCGPRSSHGLKQLLRSAWKGIPVSIEENVPRLTAVVNRRAVGRGSRLGQNAVAGSRILDCGAKFRVSLGPLEYRQYKTFLPGGDDYRQLREIVTRYLSEPLICELELSCRLSELPPARLGAGDGRVGRTAVLGRAPDAETGTHRYRGVVNG